VAVELGRVGRVAEELVALASYTSQPNRISGFPSASRS
jgi:hypothetical protein